MVFDVIIGRSKKDVEKFGKEGTVLIGKQYVKMGQTTSLSNPVYMDVAGAHVVFIVGKRGSGKCLHGDTLITLDDGSLVKIKDLEEKNQNIYTLNSDFKIHEGQKSHFYKREVDRIFEVKFRTGKIIKLTPEHPLLTVKGWSPIEKLNIGSRVATPRKLESFGDLSIKECEVKLLAYLIAEGHLGNRFVLFSNKDQKIVSDFKQSVYDFDDNLRIERHSDDSCFRVSQIKKVMKEQSSRDENGQFINNPKWDHSSIRNWLEELKLYETRSLTKFVPDCIFTMPKHQISLFLNRLFKASPSCNLL